MKDLIWKLTVEWPAALGDWLWKTFVEMPAASLRQLTLRRVLTVLAIAVLAVFLAQAAPIDLAFLFAADAVTYFEVIALVSMFAARGHARQLLSAVVRLAKNAWRVSAKLLNNEHLRGYRPRHLCTRTTARYRRLRSNSRKSDDDLGFILAGMYA